MTKKEINAIIDAMFSNNGVIDDHDGSSVYHPEKALIKLNARGDMEVAFAYEYGKTAYFSVNAVTLDDNGQAHLSPMSIGGTVDFRNATSFEDAIAQYNTGHLCNEGWSKHVLMPVYKEA